MTTTRGESGRTVSFASRPLMAPARPAQPFPSLDQLVIGTAEMSLRALEPKTRSDYARAFCQWNLFVLYYRYPALPTVVSLCQFVYWWYRLVSTVYQTLSCLAHYFKPIMGDEWNRIRSCRAVKLVIIGGIKTWRRAAKRATPLPFASVDYSLKAGVSDAAVSYDHLVFLTMVALGFGACARCAELCAPNTVAYWDYNKLPCHDTVKIEKDSFIVHLPYHKADQRWQGLHFIVVRILLHETNNSRTQTSSSLRAMVTLPHVHGSSVVFEASSDRIAAGNPSDPAVQPTTLYEATQRIRSNV
ncbi:BQ5605_C006g04319 [Microbotryum silenes-dioicae]|uniref:BQ5605_C006g04319 protein n=1 Tax=Microbotryum silenes-dioicae TaxID=796604 RepID=A0A2X0M6M6_9BASI|nr:BQ5605_C006g04319 [Microbotryum silenes-dioicae]